MRILFHSTYYKVVVVLDEKDNGIAIVSFDKARAFFKNKFDSLLENSIEIEEGIYSNNVNDYNYYCELDNNLGLLEVYRGSFERTDRFSSGEIRTDNGVIKYMSYKEKKNNLVFDEEDTIEEDDNLESDNRIYDKYCDKCHGSGYYNLNGLDINCDCYLKVMEREKANAKSNVPIQISKVTKENCVSIGLVPEEYKDCEFDYDKILDNLNKIGKGIDGFRIVNSKRFMDTLSSIIMACKTGSKLKHSYLLACDKGLGKNEFVYECLKHLYQRNQTCCKYISLQELGALRGEYIKQSQAISNLGYYYRDNDRELLERTIEEEGKNLIRALMKDWIKAEPKANNKDLKTSMELLEKTLLDRIYAKTAQDERIISEYEENKYKIVNTWEDYLNYPIVFVYFSGSLDRHYETEVLQELLNIRGTKALPTICLLESSLGIFKDEPTYFDDGKGGTRIDIAKTKSYFWLNMLSDASCLRASEMSGNLQDIELKSGTEYDRMTYFNCYIEYKGRLKYSLD